MGRAKYLIVDDDEEIPDLLHAVAIFGYDIVSTNNPRNALKLARDTEPDLILCDFDMPEMDGTEVSEALRADEELRLIPFMFLTALATTTDMARMHKQIGGRRAISKDSPIERVVERIEEMLKAG